MKTTTPPATVAEYIAQQPPKTRAVLKKLRALILKTAPGAEERISYRMPAYFLKGVLVYFAAWEKHIGLYPGSQAIEVFEEDLARYVHAKGSIQFPLDRPLPTALVRRIVQFRVMQKAGATDGRTSSGRGTARNVRQRSTRGRT